MRVEGAAAGEEGGTISLWLEALERFGGRALAIRMEGGARSVAELLGATVRKQG